MKRVSLDLSPVMQKTLQDIQDATGMTAANVLRTSIILFEVYVDAKTSGSKVMICSESEQVQLEMPIPIESRKETGK